MWFPAPQGRPGGGPSHPPCPPETEAVSGSWKPKGGRRAGAHGRCEGCVPAPAGLGSTSEGHVTSRASGGLRLWGLSLEIDGRLRALVDKTLTGLCVVPGALLWDSLRHCQAPREWPQSQHKSLWPGTACTALGKPLGPRGHLTGTWRSSALDRGQGARSSCRRSGDCRSRLSRMTVTPSWKHLFLMSSVPLPYHF